MKAWVPWRMYSNSRFLLLPEARSVFVSPLVEVCYVGASVRPVLFALARLPSVPLVLALFASRFFPFFLLFYHVYFGLNVLVVMTIGSYATRESRLCL
jgi:hypothetical protein